MDQDNNIHKSKKGSIVVAIIVVVIIVLAAVFILIQKNMAPLSAQPSQSTAVKAADIETILNAIKDSASSSPGISLVQREQALNAIKADSGTSTLSSEQKTVILNQIKQQ